MSHVDIPVTKLMFLVSFCSFLGYVIPSAIADGNVVNVGQGGTMEVLIFSMEKAVSFYSENIEKVNLDSVFGLRVGQGRDVIYSCTLGLSFFPSSVIVIHYRVIQHQFNKGLTPTLWDFPHSLAICT